MKYSKNRIELLAVSLYLLEDYHQKSIFWPVEMNLKNT